MSQGIFPDPMTPLCLWVAEGDCGRVMCLDCKFIRGSENCYGCPEAWRSINGKTEYYRTPQHQYSDAHGEQHV